MLLAMSPVQEVQKKVAKEQEGPQDTETKPKVFETGIKVIDLLAPILIVIWFKITMNYYLDFIIIY